MLKRSRLFERSFIDNWNWRDKVRQFLIKIFHQQYSFINIISNMSLFSLSFSLVNCEKKILLDFLLFLLLSRNKRFSTFKSSVYFFPPFKVPPLSVVKRSQSLLFARFFFLFFYRLTFHVSSSKFHMHIFFKVFPSALSMTKYLYLFIIYYYYVYYNFFFFF